MNELDELKKEITLIKKRNKKVEADKAWETSMTRRIAVAIITYIFIAFVMYTLGIENPFLSAIIPTLGYLLSTISLGVLRTWWMKHNIHN